VLRYWGFAGLALLAAAWLSPTAKPVALATLSALTTYYFLFRVPLWCCAVTRDGQLCRKNVSGLLLGCSYRQHKWQKLMMLFVSRAWRRLNEGLWVSPRQGLATLGLLASVVSAAAAVATLIGSR
jgi:hypothetical protein